MRKSFFIAVLVLFTVQALAHTLEVGSLSQYKRLQDAAAEANPGDTILIREGIYNGNDVITGLKGTSSDWIVIRAAEGEKIIFHGGSTAFILKDPEYLVIEGLIFEQQTGNGVNIDDAGSYETPAHHIKIMNCEWRNMNASGNNDELKMSGVDNFTIKNCRFLNGSEGGSLIDMVGCHQGVIENNHFENGGSNSVQAKGGSSDITIRGNRFEKGGQRAINIGGSTGLQFFRPTGTTNEASGIRVWSNIFIEGLSPVAFVGAVNCEVVNNTIIHPGRWTVRILQENVRTEFQPCGKNIFRNNIVVLSSSGQSPINIGPKTAPETFTFSNNLWYNPGFPSWRGPETPVKETDQIINRDPRFSDGQYRLKSTSPAIEKGFQTQMPECDYFGKQFRKQRAIGAVEGDR
jgi:hypothetical protein